MFTGHIGGMDVKKLLNCLIVSMLKRLPRKCEEYGDWYIEIGENVSQNPPQLRCFICNIGNHGCGENSVKNWICVDCKSVIEYGGNLIELMRHTALDS